MANRRSTRGYSGDEDNNQDLHRDEPSDTGERYQSGLSGGRRTDPIERKSPGNKNNSDNAVNRVKGNQGQNESAGPSERPRRSTRRSDNNNQDKADKQNQDIQGNGDNQTGGSKGKGQQDSNQKGASDSNPDGLTPDKNPGKGNLMADAGADPKKGLTGDLGGLDMEPDYSDKSKMSQLEHKAADKAMDATPYLSQVNSARKALKKFNKEKNKNRPENAEPDVLDKTEEVVDKGVDAGIKTVKVAGAAGAGGVTGFGAMMMAALMKTLLVIKGALMNAVGFLAAIGQMIASVFTAITSAISTMFSIGTALAATIVSAATATTLVAGSVIAVLFIGGGNNDAGVLGCVPDRTSISSEAEEVIMGDGEADVKRKDYTQKLWSIYSELGGTKEKTAAVLGNLHVESAGLDPTGVETVFTEPFTIGPEKQRAIDLDFDIKKFNPSYAAKYPAIEHMGIGLTQWTNGRNRLLVEFAEEKDRDWYEFDTQMLFMLYGDDPMRQNQLHDFLKSSGSNVDTETQKFMNGWVGISDGSTGERQKHARTYMLMLEKMTADKDYAKSILSDTNVSTSKGNSARAEYEQDDGCGEAVKSHYAGGAADGTGVVPPDSYGYYKRHDLPAALQKYAIDPEETGIMWKSTEGWAHPVLYDQCVALSDSYMWQLYPEWNQDGRSKSKPGGNGLHTARNWAAHFGEKTTPVPSKGAVFSNSVVMPYGHTGIVQHVFENGDILVVEQNIRGYSGAGNNESSTWSWQVLRESQYTSENWEFFKPSGMEPRWYKDGRKVDDSVDEDDEDDKAA